VNRLVADIGLADLDTGKRRLDGKGMIEERGEVDEPGYGREQLELGIDLLSGSKLGEDVVIRGDVSVAFAHAEILYGQKGAGWNDDAVRIGRIGVAAVVRAGRRRS
jgi:hypothetical protein